MPAPRAVRFSLGRVVMTSFSVLMRNIVPFMVITFAFAIPGWLFTWWRRGVLVDPHAGFFSRYTLMIALGVIIGTVAHVLSQSALIFGAVQHLRGKKVRLGECLSRSLSVAPKVVAAVIVWLLTVGVGSSLLVVPGIIVMVMFWVYVPAIVIEGAGIFGSLGRSRVLTKGHRWAIFGLFCFAFLLIVGVEFIFIIKMGPGGYAAMMGSGWMPWIVTAVSVVIGAYASVLGAVGYYFLRAEKEGIDVDELVTVFD
jgi:hypothetical protein